MGYCEWACNHWTISFTTLMEMFLNEMVAIEDAWSDETWPEVDEGEGSPEVLAAYDRLKSAFHAKTGLHLYVVPYDSTMSGYHDHEVDGSMFCVSGVTEMTPAGREWQHMLHESSWVEGG